MIDVQRPSQGSTPVTAKGETSIERQALQGIAGPTGTLTQKQNQARRGGLQLQVPERSGGLIRLATPTVLVNGEGGKEPASFVHGSDYWDGESDTETFLLRHRQAASPQENELVKCLARRLSKTVFVMGSSRPDLGIARRLAENAIGNLRYAYKDLTDEDSFIADCALWFGLAEDLEIRYGTRSTMSELRILPADTNAAEMETTIDPLHGPGRSNGETNKKAADKSHQRFLMTWKLSFGPLSANLSLPVSLPRHPNEQSPAATTANTGTSGAATTTEGGLGEQHWKEKYFRLRQEKEEEATRMRRAVLKACF